MPKRRFEYTEGNSSKFWEITINGAMMYVHYGRIGTAGQHQTKPFLSGDRAEQEAKKLIASKLKKGYREVEVAAVG